MDAQQVTTTTYDLYLSENENATMYPKSHRFDRAKIFLALIHNIDCSR